jgi:hypothetical protein
MNREKRGCDRVIKGVNLTKVHHVHVRKYNNETKNKF